MTHEVYLARQPIYDQKLGLHAYELLYRDGPFNRASFADADQATADLVMTALADIGLDTLVGRHRAFINVTPAFVLGALPLALPAGRIALEVPDTRFMSDDFLTALQRQVEQDNLIVLDNFEYRPELEAALAVADIVKISVDGADLDELSARIRPLRERPIELLARNVETAEEFELCKKLGFQYFQGYYFCKPQLVGGQRPGSNRLIALKLLAQLQDRGCEVDQLEALLAQDPALPYRLLRYLNSAAFGFRSEVTSIRHAITLLGLESMRKWASLILMSRMANDKPRELVVTAMVRAKMCELIGATDPALGADAYFTAGLFSVLDALLDVPMTEALEAIPIASEIRAAILGHSGQIGVVLRYVQDFEKGVWWEPEEAGSEQPATGYQDAYLQAIRWADESTRAVFQ